MDFQPLNPTKQPLGGTQIIEASAGTGKTYTIATLFLRLLLEFDFTVEQILVVTFTEAATEELRGRLREKLREAIHFVESGQISDPSMESYLQPFLEQKEITLQTLLKAYHRFDEASVFTIHGFCFRVLQDNPIESEALHSLQLMTELDEVMEEIVSDFWRSYIFSAPDLFVQFLLDQGYQPATLQKLLMTSPTHPFIRKIPDAALLDLNINRAEMDFRQAFQELKEMWEQSQTEIQRILLEAPHLNRKRYNVKTTIPKLCKQMTSYLQGKPRVKLFKDFEKWFQSTLSVSLNKGAKEAPTHPFFALCEAFASIAEKTATTLKNYWIYWKHHLFTFAKGRLKQMEKEQGLLSFDALLYKVYDALHSTRGQRLIEQVREQFKVALIDEFQDTDPVQYEIFKRLFHQFQQLYLIGDPKQAIYAFRGADLFTYLKARDDSQQRWTLDTNWRSEEQLIRAVNTLFSQSSWSPFFFQSLHFQEVLPSPKASEAVFVNELRPNDGALSCCFFSRDVGCKHTVTIDKGKAEEQIIQELLADITQLLQQSQEGTAYILQNGEKRKISPKDIAILVRKNDQTQKIQYELQKLGLPSVIHKRESLWNTEEAYELERILEAIHEPNKENLLKDALVTKTLGFSGNQLFHHFQHDKLWESLIERFQYLRKQWDTLGFSVMFRTMLLQFSVKANLLSYQDGEKRLTNLLHLGECLQQACNRQSMSIFGLTRWLRERRSEPEKTTEDEEVRIESEGEVVQIITIHRSKGLEYPIVFCPYLWEGSSLSRADKEKLLFHDPSQDNQMTLDLGSEQFEEHGELALDEMMAEDLRLLYVALTRAKHRCFLYLGKIRDAGKSALSYLLFAPEEPAPTHERRQRLEAAFGLLSDKDMLAKLQQLSIVSQGAIQIKRAEHKVPTRLRLEQRNEEELVAQSLPENFTLHERRPILTSFSALQHAKIEQQFLFEQEIFDYDQIEVEETQNQKRNKQTIFDFPKGARTGNLLHNILQFMDFADTHSIFFQKLITEQCQLFGYDVDEYSYLLQDWMERIVTTPLSPKDKKLTLANIKQSDRLDEMEFYFPIRQCSQQELTSLFTAHGFEEKTGSFSCKKLQFQPFYGTMKGFIDCIFRYKNKFYLVDYKSNSLGHEQEDYRPEKLREAMQEHQYGLQYHLYLVALTSYLRRRMPDFSYEKHFGGVFYLFLRGMDPLLPGSGVFFDRPSKDLIENFTNYFLLPENEKSV